MKAAAKVAQFLQDVATVSPSAHEQVSEIRQLFLQADAAIGETIKYGGLVFMFGASSRLLGGIFIYRKHLSVEFGQGAQFDDPDGILDGQGQYRRHIKIHQLDDIQGKRMAGFIQQAIAIQLGELQ